jgi:hypothetical protein
MTGAEKLDAMTETLAAMQIRAAERRGAERMRERAVEIVLSERGMGLIEQSGRELLARAIRSLPLE